jgi:hypothetical protein
VDDVDVEVDVDVVEVDVEVEEVDVDVDDVDVDVDEVDVDDDDVEVEDVEVDELDDVELAVGLVQWQYSWSRSLWSSLCAGTLPRAGTRTTASKIT